MSDVRREVQEYNQAVVNNRPASRPLTARRFAIDTFRRVTPTRTTAVS